MNLNAANWDAISTVILAITAVIIWLQTKATKDLVENDVRPVVEASFIHEKDRGTYLQFLNKKPEIPALAWVKISFNIDGKILEEKFEAKLAGLEPWRVLHPKYRTNYLPDPRKVIEKFGNKQIELLVELSVAPLFLPQKRTLFYSKTYRFENFQWIDTHWGISDIPLFKE